MEAANPIMPFGQVLDAVEQLTPEEQEELAQVVRRRLAERGRKQVVQDLADARADMARGACEVSTVDKLMDEILS